MHNRLGITLCFAFLGTALLAQDSVQRAVPAITDPTLNVNLPAQRVGPEDLITVNVYDSPEFTRSVRVALDGSIRLPMMKKTIPVAGLMPDEIAERIVDALKREQLLVDPYVTVNIAEYHSRPVNVTGAVRNPINFQAVGSLTLLDALARAGGVLTSEAAGADIIVTRENGAAGQSVQRIPVKALMSGADPDLNLKLTGGEEILVPEVGKIVVEGNVAKPGIYPVLDPLSTNTVMTAIAQAGGLAQFADHVAYIIRTDDQGNVHRIQVPLWDIQNRKKPDITLQARDTLQVPDSPKRRITQQVITTASGVGAAVTTGVVVYHK